MCTHMHIPNRTDQHPKIGDLDGVQNGSPSGVGTHGSINLGVMKLTTFWRLREVDPKWVKCDTTCDIEINNVRDNGLIGPYPNDMNFMIAHVCTCSHGSTTPRKRSKKGCQKWSKFDDIRGFEMVRSWDPEIETTKIWMVRSWDRQIGWPKSPPVDMFCRSRWDCDHDWWDVKSQPNVIAISLLRTLRSVHGIVNVYTHAQTHSDL